MRTLAIGDIHGCNTALVTLLKTVQPAKEDRLVFLGDYIDRGPASREVIESLLNLRTDSSPNFLRGNHEVMLFDARDDPVKGSFWQSYGGLETLISYGAKTRNDWVSAIPDAHWEFFERTAKFFETDTHLYVHACLDADLDMREQPDWLLYWEVFEQIRPHKSGKQIICGHTRQRSGEIKYTDFAACIDTGAAVGGWLTCLESSSGQFWQANESGQVRDGKLGGWFDGWYRQNHQP